MAAISTQTLLSEVRCFACYGFSVAQLLKIALMRRYLLKINAAADVSPAALLEYGKCYACLNLTLYEVFELSLLDKIYQS